MPTLPTILCWQSRACKNGKGNVRNRSSKSVAGNNNSTSSAIVTNLNGKRFGSTLYNTFFKREPIRTDTSRRAQYPRRVSSRTLMLGRRSQCNLCRNSGQPRVAELSIGSIVDLIRILLGSVASKCHWSDHSCLYPRINRRRICGTTIFRTSYFLVCLIMQQRLVSFLY